MTSAQFRNLQRGTAPKNPAGCAESPSPGYKILAIDPGTTESAYCYYERYYERQYWNRHTQLIEANVGQHDKIDNHSLLVGLRNDLRADILVVEMIASYGMPVGAEVFETCVWIGRFLEAWKGKSARLRRIEIKSHLCHSAKANDSNIRQALIDRFGPPGTKKNPGKLYGMHGDVWAALAVAVTYADKNVFLETI